MFFYPCKLAVCIFKKTKKNQKTNSKWQSSNFHFSFGLKSQYMWTYWRDCSGYFTCNTWPFELKLATGGCTVCWLSNNTELISNGYRWKSKNIESFSNLSVIAKAACSSLHSNAFMRRLSDSVAKSPAGYCLCLNPVQACATVVTGWLFWYIHTSSIPFVHFKEKLPAFASQ